MKTKNRIPYRLFLLSLSVLLLALSCSACKKKNPALVVNDPEHITTREKETTKPVEKKPSLGLHYNRNTNEENKHDGTCTVAGIGTCKDTDLVIPPNTYSNGDIVAVAKAAFKDCTQLTSVTIPDGVTSIGAEAFAGCTELQTVSIPDSVTEIGTNVFADCPNLQYTELGGAEFLGNESNPYVILIRVKDKNVTAFSIPEQTKIIYADAFSGCAALKNLTVPNSIIQICDRAFYGCEKIQNATVGTGVTAIGRSAFAGCNAIESLKVPFIGETVGYTTNTFIGYFFGAEKFAESAEKVPSSLKTVTVTGDRVIGNYAFYQCENITKVRISGEVTEIGMRAFWKCSGLTEVVLPESLTVIGIDAFRECTALTEITISDAVTDLGGLVFYGCTNLQKITIGKNVEKLDNDVLGNCPALTEIHYTGTKAAWNQLEKAANWDDDGTSNYTVICSDGPISE